MGGDSISGPEACQGKGSPDMPRYPLVFFDLDGTLADSRPGIVAAVRHALGRMGREAPPDGDLTRFIGPPITRSMRMFCGMSEADARAAYGHFREHYQAAGIYDQALYPGVPEMLDGLAAAGARMAIVTGKITRNADEAARFLGLAPRFALVAGSELDGARQDKADTIRYALDRLDPERRLPAVMVGDRDLDILGARGAGVDSVGALWGYGPRAELEAAGAGWLAASPLDLLAYLAAEA